MNKRFGSDNSPGYPVCPLFIPPSRALDNDRGPYRHGNGGSFGLSEVDLPPRTFLVLSLCIDRYTEPIPYALPRSVMVPPYEILVQGENINLYSTRNRA